MPDLKNIAKNPRTPGLAALAIALGALAVNIASDDPAREDKLAQLGEVLKAEDLDTKTQPAEAGKLDTKALHTEIRKIRDTDPALVDLGGGLVEPGVTYVTGVNVTKDSHLVAIADCPGHLEAEGYVCVLDPGAWAIEKLWCGEKNAGDPMTWCEVTARNTGDRAQRFLALVRTEVTP